jgi:stage V sporulation protein G
VKLHADIAHPINSGCREVIQSAVLRAFQMEKERSRQPGYVCTYDDYDSPEFEGSSYTQIVSEISGKGYRTDKAHGHTRGGHTASGAAAPREEKANDFGAGVM